MSPHNNSGSAKDSFYLPGEEKFGFIEASLYNLFNLNPVVKGFYNFVLSDLRESDPGLLLDIGSGTGTILLKFAKENGKAKALGIDPSPSMVKVSNRKARRKGVSERVSFVLGSSRAIPGDGSFDTIMTSLSLHHWLERENSVKHIMSRVSPGGRFVVYEISGHSGVSRKVVRAHLMQKEDFTAIASNLGLEVKLMEKNDYIRAEFLK